MYIKKTYVAEDGKEFEFKNACLAYESSIFEKMYASTLIPFIVLFGMGGQPVSYYNMDESYYVYVKQIPDWDDDDFMNVWNKVISGNLTAEIGGNGTGWYFKDDYNNWYSWAEKEKFYEQMKHAFAKMYESIH